MGYYSRLAIGVAASLLLHALFEWAMGDAPPRPERKPYRVTMAVERVQPEAAPEPEALAKAPDEPVEVPALADEPEVVEDPVESPEDTPKVVKKKKKRVKTKKKRNPRKVTKAQTTRESETTTPSDSTTASGEKRRRFGVSLSSTSSAGSGAELPTGNSLDGGASRDGAMGGGAAKSRGTGAGPSGPSGDGPGEVVEVETLTRMPRIEGRCRGRYTQAAKEAGLEGTVVLSALIGADGRATEIQVVRGLGMGLDESAKKALAACLFSPGVRQGQPVAVRLSAFKIRYVLDGR